jgi:hypothetical protein
VSASLVGSNGASQTVATLPPRFERAEVAQPASPASATSELTGATDVEPSVSLVEDASPVDASVDASEPASESLETPPSSLPAPPSSLDTLPPSPASASLVATEDELSELVVASPASGVPTGGLGLASEKNVKVRS